MLTNHRKVAEHFGYCIEGNVLRDIFEALWFSWFKFPAQVFRKVAVDNALHHIIRALL